MVIHAQQPALSDELITQFDSLAGEEQQRRFVAALIQGGAWESLDLLVDHLVAQVAAFQLADAPQALALADLIAQIAALSGIRKYAADALRMRAQVLLISRGAYEDSLALYDAALEIYQEVGDDQGQALVQVTRIWALATMGRYEEAFAASEWAAGVLTAHENWLSLAKLKNNLAAIYNRMNDYEKALEVISESRAAYEREGSASAAFLPSCDLTRGFILFNLGRLQDALAAYDSAVALAEAAGQIQVIAQAQSNSAQVHFSQGDYNEALLLFDRATESFLAQGLEHDALITGLAATDCLLELRRFEQALDKCRHLEQQLTAAGLRLEGAQALYNAGLALTGLKQYEAAQQALSQAQSAFDALGNRFWAAVARLRIADVQTLQGDHTAGLATALECVALFSRMGAGIESAQARLIAARAALAAHDKQQAAELIAAVMRFAGAEDAALLAFQAYQLEGDLSLAAGQLPEAIAAYDHAVEHIEHLQGRLMVEYRADFLVDKERVFQRLVSLYLGQDATDVALDYVQRAKSRALHDMLANRLDIGINARSEQDKALVAELNQLRRRRNQITSFRTDAGADPAAGPGVDDSAQKRELAELEHAITEKWHRLLVRNGDYAHDAQLLERRRLMSAQPPKLDWHQLTAELDADTLLLEYYAVDDQLCVFIVSREGVRAEALPATLTTVQRWMQQLGLRMRAAPRCPPRHMAQLIAGTDSTLEQLAEFLIAPIAPHLDARRKLIIAPHGPLHYLPFHALRLDDCYLLQSFEISYLPGASFISFYGQPSGLTHNMLAVGHSYRGVLPHALSEAETVGRLWPGETLLEEDATLDSILHRMSEFTLLHLATHGDFRADNPLFSGLVLADGWLTTLDIFGLRLRASLVTLSACRTGRSVIGGGDELLGLMRAFLAAGAASLVLTLWPVEDTSTSRLMTTFYQQLAGGLSKSAALRRAQIALLSEDTDIYAHPYFWAPFFLVGHSGAL